MSDSTAEALQNEVVRYMQFAADEADALLHCLTAERDALLAVAPSSSGIAASLLTFMINFQADAPTGYRRIDLSSERAVGFVEANGTSIGMVETEIKHRKTGNVLCDSHNRRLEAVANKSIDEQCHTLVRTLLLA